VDPDRDHWRGAARAVVTLVEYGDYECPCSRMAFRAIQRLEEQLGGQLRFVFRHFPLTRVHPHALAAAHSPRRPPCGAASGAVGAGRRRQPPRKPRLRDPTLFVNGPLHLVGCDEATLGAALATAIKER
jgi:hypothetical protein